MQVGDIFEPFAHPWIDRSSVWLSYIYATWPVQLLLSAIVRGPLTWLSHAYFLLVWDGRPLVDVCGQLTSLPASHFEREPQLCLERLRVLLLQVLILSTIVLVASFLLYKTCQGARTVTLSPRSKALLTRYLRTP